MQNTDTRYEGKETVIRVDYAEYGYEGKETVIRVDYAEYGYEGKETVIRVDYAETGTKIRLPLKKLMLKLLLKDIPVFKFKWASESINFP
jgi:hypothetical protein